MRFLQTDAGIWVTVGPWGISDRALNNNEIKTTSTTTMLSTVFYAHILVSSNNYININNYYYYCVRWRNMLMRFVFCYGQVSYLFTIFYSTHHTRILKNN